MPYSSKIVGLVCNFTNINDGPLNNNFNNFGIYSTSFLYLMQSNIIVWVAGGIVLPIVIMIANKYRSKKGM